MVGIVFPHISRRYRGPIPDLSGTSVMYGNSDAALVYFKLFKKHLMEEMGMSQSLVDPCVFYKKRR